MLPADILVEVVDVPRRAYLPLPDLRVIERPGWMQIITPSFRTGGFNGVSKTVLAADEADAVIAQTIAEYRALGITFRWTVGPDCAPADLGERLARAGLTPTVACGMWRAIDAGPTARGDIKHPTTDDDAAIEIIEVDASTVDEYTRAMAEGWSTDPAPLARANALALAEPDRSHLFLARWRGQAAATASYVAFPRSAYLLGAVVLPAARRHGLYGALVQARLDHARARGLELATCHARAETSAPLLERLGFATICRLTSYHG